jgi:hyperosmotically inducible protein
MLKRMSVLFCGVVFALTTAGLAAAQTAAQDAKDKTKATASQTGEVVTDAAITSAVKTKLLGDPDVKGLNIDVDTKDGVVTLSGKVNTAAERAEALRLARSTKGVKRVSDKLVRDTAATTGRADKDDGKLKVEIKDDTKETAAKVKDASRKGADKTGEVVTDAAITTAVKTKFLADTKVPGLKIDVDTKDGVVTLTGTVKSAAEKAEAIRLANTTKGVKSVVDKLTIQQ